MIVDLCNLFFFLKFDEILFLMLIFGFFLEFIDVGFLMILFVEMGEFEIIMILFIFCIKFVFISLDCEIFDFLFFLELFDNGFWIKLFDLGEFEMIIILLILEI